MKYVDRFLAKYPRCRGTVKNRAFLLRKASWFFLAVFVTSAILGAAPDAGGTGGLYQGYYEHPPYNRSSAKFFHNAGCTTECHYAHERKEYPGETGVFCLNRARGQNAAPVCNPCHKRAAPDGVVTPFTDIWSAGTWLFPGNDLYRTSSHAKMQILWPGAPPSVSRYPRVTLPSFKGYCFNCHNPHAQPDPNASPPDTRPFPAKAVAGIDLVRIRDTGGRRNGLRGDGAGGYDSDHGEDLCYACHDPDGPARTRNASGRLLSVKVQFQGASHHPVLDSEQSSSPLDPPGAWQVECNVCHNPHLAAPWSPRTSPVCLPSDNTAPWLGKLSEAMPATDGNGKRVVYARPEGSPAAAAKLDTIGFCGTCHSSPCGGAQQANDYQGLAHDPIPFRDRDCPEPVNRHGLGAAGGTSSGSLKPRFLQRSKELEWNLYLACTDCHEHHGSPNAFLLRTRVNGVGGLVAGPDGRWYAFCSACHEIREHETSEGPVKTRSCKPCHHHGSEHF